MTTQIRACAKRPGRACPTSLIEFRRPYAASASAAALGHRVLVNGDAEPAGFQKSTTYAEQRLYAARFVLVDQAAENRTTFDPCLAEVGHGVARPWRVKFTGAVSRRPL